MFESYVTFFHNPNVLETLKIIYYTSFVWLPLGLFLMLYETWVDYRRESYIAKQTYVLLEIKLPKEIFKSPQAMEFFIGGLYQTAGEGNWYEKFWLGQVRAWFSLEIVSIDGVIHFFIWTRKGNKAQIEANLYSQFPGIEVYEVPDYTLPVTFNPEMMNMWATEFDLNNADAFPIKTYIDYGLDKDPKEEYKIDPLTPLVEFLGSLPRGQQAWIQIIVRAHKATDVDPVTDKMIDLKWKKAGEKAIEDIIKKTKGEKGEDGKIIPGSTRFMTDGETQTVKALERSIGKTGFDVGIRAIYIASKDDFNASNIGGIMGGITHFNSSLNGFKGARGVAPKYKYFPWKSRPSKKINAEKQELLDAYKRRAYFYKPYKRPYFVLNVEELATIFHFPGGVLSTPTLTRIGSKKSEAPSNLPL